MALDGGQLDKAKEYADKALAINDKAINGYLLLADVAYKRKDNAEVEKVLLTAQEKVNGDIQGRSGSDSKPGGKFYRLQNQPEKILSLTEERKYKAISSLHPRSHLHGAPIIQTQREK